MNTIDHYSQMTQSAIDEFKKAAKLEGPDLAKAGITQATGLTFYDLQAPSKQLFPVLTPFRNRVPRVSGNGGTATNWKAVTGINTASLRGFVPEGKRNGAVTTTVADKSASYKTLGLEDTVSYEAQFAGEGLEDVRARAQTRLLWATMIEEELADIGANLSVALGTPTAPTLVTASSGGSIGAGTYKVYVVALTMMGYIASSVTNGVATSVSVTNPAGGTFTYKAGSSNKSAAATSSTLSGSTNVIAASTPVVAGAVAYAWYVDDGASGDATLQAITAINSVSLTALTTTHQNLTAITADNSQNTLGYDGLLYHAWATSSGAYIKNLATGTPGSGNGLTADGAGGITEINDLFLSLWENYKISPDRILCNAQEINNITNKVLSAGDSTKTVARVQYVQSGDVSSGLRVKSLLNRFALNGAIDVPVEIHPNLPPGTLVAYSEQLPYPISGVPNVIEKKLRRDYYAMEWPQRERVYEMGVYFDGVLAHYFTPSIGIITNIANK